MKLWRSIEESMVNNYTVEVSSGDYHGTYNYLTNEVTVSLPSGIPFTWSIRDFSAINRAYRASEGKDTQFIMFLEHAFQFLGWFSESQRTFIRVCVALGYVPQIAQDRDLGLYVRLDARCEKWDDVYQFLFSDCFVFQGDDIWLVVTPSIQGASLSLIQKLLSQELPDQTYVPLQSHSS